MTSNLRRFLVAARVALLAVAPTAAQAQFTFLIDGGQREDTFRTGFKPKGFFGGVALSAILNGFGDAGSGMYLPLTGEMRWSDFGVWDAKLSWDMMFRIGPIAFGGGTDLWYPSAPDVPDASESDGKMVVIDQQLLGYALASKINLPPLGRTFLQARYTAYDIGLDLIDVCNSEYYTSDVAASCYELKQQHDPAFRYADDLRIGTGYVFSGSPTTILRIQYVKQRIQYEPEKDNRNGAYDRRIQYVTIGLAWPFAF